MQFTISGKHISVTESLREYAEEKTSKFPKYYSVINKVEVIVDASKGNNFSVEIIAKGEHSNVFVVKENGDDIFKCIDIASHKLEGQLKKKKGKERDNKY